MSTIYDSTILISSSVNPYNSYTAGQWTCRYSQSPVAGTLSPAATVDCAYAIRACAPRARPAYRAALCWALAELNEDSLPEKRHHCTQFILLRLRSPSAKINIQTINGTRIVR